MKNGIPYSVANNQVPKPISPDILVSFVENTILWGKIS